MIVLKKKLKVSSDNMIITKKDILNTNGYKKITDYSVVKISNNIIYYKKNNKLGLMDISGNVITDAIYDEINDFYNGFAVVNENNYLGLINTSGKEVIETRYFDIEFIDEYNVFICGNNKLIDTTGRELTETYGKFYNIDFIKYLGKGIFLIHDYPHEALIDYRGWVIKKPEKFARYSLKSNKYIVDERMFSIKVYDLEGNFLFKTSYAFIDLIENNKILLFKNGKLKIVDEAGLVREKMYIKHFSYQCDFNHNILFENLENDQYILITKDRIELQFQLLDYLVDYIKDNFIVAENSDNIYKVLNFYGQTLLDNLTCVDVIDDIFIKIRKDNKEGVYKYESEILKTIISPNYNKISKLGINFFLAQNDDEYNIYDKNGKIIYCSKNEIIIKDEKDGLIVIGYKHKNLNSLFNKNGDIIIPFVENDILIFNSNQILIDNKLVDLNQEYLNIEVDYQIILESNQEYVYSFSSQFIRDSVLKEIENNSFDILENNCIKTYEKRKK